jgi:hypothetical protein
VRISPQDAAAPLATANYGPAAVTWGLGSVAEKVVSHATMPVLLFRVLGIKPPKTKADFLERLDRGIP